MIRLLNTLKKQKNIINFSGQNLAQSFDNVFLCANISKLVAKGGFKISLKDRKLSLNQKKKGD